MSEAEDRISELQDTIWEKLWNRKLEEELSKAKKAIQELKNTIQRTNIRIMDISESIGGETGFKSVFNEVIRKNISDMEKQNEKPITGRSENPK